MRKICVVCGNEFDARGRMVCCSKECSRERRREYMVKYNEENREYAAKYREENRERRREQALKYRKENPEKLAKYHEENRERRREQALKYNEENRERRRERGAQLYRNKCLTINTMKARGEEL